MMFRTRDLLVRQRTQTINALRGHLAEFGVVAPRGLLTSGRCRQRWRTRRPRCRRWCASWRSATSSRSRPSPSKITELEKRLRTEAAGDETTRRLQTMPGVGPITAMAIEAFAPADGSSSAAGTTSPPGWGWCRGSTPPAASRCWEGLEDGSARHPSAADHRRHGGGALGGPQGRAGGLPLAGADAGTKKDRMLVAIALANRMARGLWAMLTKREDYRDPAAA